MSLEIPYEAVVGMRWKGLQRRMFMLCTSYTSLGPTFRASHVHTSAAGLEPVPTCHLQPCRRMQWEALRCGPAFSEGCKEGTSAYNGVQVCHQGCCAPQPHMACGLQSQPALALCLSTLAAQALHGTWARSVQAALTALLRLDHQQGVCQQLEVLCFSCMYCPYRCVCVCVGC